MHLRLASSIMIVITACGGSDPVGADGGGGPDGGGAADAASPDATPVDPTAAVFDPDVFHDIVIEVDPTYLDQLEDDRENRVPCDITFDGVRVDGAGIRQKGGYGSVSTLDGKPGFSVKLDEFVPGQELHGLDKITLNNAIQDPTFLHEHLGYELYRAAGIPAPRTAHGVVTLLGFPEPRTYGIYVVKESIDKKFLARHFGDGNQEGNLYEGECCADFVWDPFWPELKDELEEMRSRDDMIQLAATIRDTPDATFATAVGARLDLDNFMTSFAVDALVWHWDGYAYNVNNHFLYHHPVTDRFLFMPHGMDQLFQDTCVDPLAWPNGRLAQRVREIPALDAMYQGEVARVAGTWDLPALQARVQRVSATLHGTPRSEPRVVEDLASFDGWMQPTIDAVATRKAIVIGMSDAVCGDGVVEGLEVCGCDDGNLVAEDGCSPTCVPEWCGDGIVQPGLGEACDGAGCRFDCSGPAVCGDGILDNGEECDDGNTAPGDGCDPGCVWGCVDDTYAGASYRFCPRALSAWDAELDCEAAGGALVVPTSDAENTWVSTRAFALVSENFWLGLTDEASEDTWLTFAGVPASYFAWAPGRPNGGTGQNCVMFDPAEGGLWNDRGCWDAYGYVCRL